MSNKARDFLSKNESAVSDAERRECVRRFFYSEEKFQGNQEDYYDPWNSCVNKVIERKVGIPISLAIVYFEMSRLLDLPVRLIGFPGHFLLDIGSEKELYLDPLHGVSLTREDCLVLLQRSFGQESIMEESFFQVASPRKVLIRLLTNLKHIWVLGDDLQKAKTYCDSILSLDPKQADTLRDRGLILSRMERFQEAKLDFENFLELSPDDRYAPVVKDELSKVQEILGNLQ